MQWIIKHLLTPKQFYITSKALLPWLSVAYIILLLYGLIAGLFLAPADYQQGDGFRIMYVHVPSAFCSMLIYGIMTVCAIITVIWRVKIASICMISSASIGAWFAFLTLISGAIWGKPMWGTWWIWDARLTSMLILFFQYIGFIILYKLLQDKINGEIACAILVIIGSINLPIIHYSVTWWNTLHQGATISKLSAPSIALPMLYPLLAMLGSFLLFYSIVLILNMHNQILQRELKSRWLRELFL